jgi:hypothetical protein
MTVDRGTRNSGEFRYIVRRVAAGFTGSLHALNYVEPFAV